MVMTTDADGVVMMVMGMMKIMMIMMRMLMVMATARVIIRLLRTPEASHMHVLSIANLTTC